MEYAIRIEPSAYLQIIDAISFLKKVSIEAAEQLYKEIFESINSLKEMPFRYPVDDTYKVASQEERKMIIGNGRYFVLYCVENNVVCIEYFHDSRRKQ